VKRSALASKRFKIVAADDEVYYVYARDNTEAINTFCRAMSACIKTTIEDTEEWKTAIFDGRAAPGGWKNRGEVLT
jgi:hypothetical protein